ncbi:MAG: TIGR01841 family phasin [Sphingobium sp.]
MATPPKSTPRKPVVKKVASPVNPSAKAAPAAKAPGVTSAKGGSAPYVIESEALASFVDKSDSTLPTAKKIAETPPVPAPKSEAPVAPTPVAAVEKAVAPVEKALPVKAPPPVKIEPVKIEPVAKATVPEPAPKPEAIVPPVSAPVAAAPAAPVEEIKAPSPSQPAVADKKVAAKELAAQWQAAPNALEGHYIMNEAIETSKKFAEDAKVRFQSLVTDFNDKAKVAAEKSSKTAEEFSDIAKGNLEALVESSKIAAKGFETLGQNAAEYGRQSFEKTSATLKSFASVKSPTEFFQLQSELLTSAFDTLASETAKTSEAVLKLAGEIAQPLSNRYAVVSDKLKSLAA